MGEIAKERIEDDIPIIPLDLPRWLPRAAQHYLAHIEAGKPIRAIARAAQVHPSTILRQIRRIEQSREDPVVDEALRRFALTGQAPRTARVTAAQIRREKAALEIEAAQDAFLDAEMWRIMVRLTEPGVSLVMAKGLEKGILVRESEGAEPLRLGIVSQDLIGRMALRAWILAAQPEARVLRYRLTPTGRAALRQRREQGASAEDEGRYQRPQESPILALARRKDGAGKAYLGRDLQRVAELLREDFELSQLQSRGEVPEAVLQARLRFDTAQMVLGAGLCDVAVAACCHLEGLEHIEKRLGWAARSGKVVLKIALERLQAHYAALQGGYGPKIG